MADLKISQLTGATPPLTGTETVPLVQGGLTKKVSVANLTAGRAVASAGGTFSDNYIQGTAAKGVNFTANTPAAGMTSQLLNWYETGTFTPTVTGTSIAGAATYTIQVGNYIRIGNMVQFQISLGWSAHTGTGNFAPVAGLPFTAASTTNNYAVPSVFTSDLAMTAGNTIQAFISPGTNTIALRQIPTGGGTTAVIPLDTAVTFLFITGSYTVA